jgi:NAD(P)-dependent dehydrogenase (short-subunit alcohol dehydrogenase family)
MNGAYVATKYAVVGYSETLALDLASYGSRVRVSVVCPGLVRTDIGTALIEERIAALDEPQQAMNRAVAQGLATGMETQEAARIVLEGVRANRFYILTHPEAMPLAEARIQSIIEGGQPSFQMAAG